MMKLNGKLNLETDPLPNWHRGMAGRNKREHRRGAASIELVVSAVLLITVMTFVTSICFRINLVWKDVGQHRVALGELANQMEVLTLLTPENARPTIETIKPSEVCARTLITPKISGETIEDELGTRIVLRINWKQRGDGKPVELAGWIISKPVVPASKQSDDNSKPKETDLSDTEDAPPTPRSRDQ